MGFFKKLPRLLLIVFQVNTIHKNGIKWAKTVEGQSPTQASEVGLCSGRSFLVVVKEALQEITWGITNYHPLIPSYGGSIKIHRFLGRFLHFIERAVSRVVPNRLQ